MLAADLNAHHRLYQTCSPLMCCDPSCSVEPKTLNLLLEARRRS